MSKYFEQSELLWVPGQPGTSAVERFRCYINRKHGLNLRDYHDLHRYSVERLQFWQDLWSYLRIIYSIPPSEIIIPGNIPEIPRWFPEARLNFAENLLWRKDDGIACTVCSESGKCRDYSYRELHAMVGRTAIALRIHGLQVGDRVAAIITNSIDALVIALATASVGGIYSSTATDMGAQGILDRYRQIQPKFIFAETEVAYAGQVINLLPKVAEVVRDLSNRGLTKAILLPSSVTGKEASLKQARCTPLSSFLSNNRVPDANIEFEQLPFSQPLFILYSSGTSGPPKCIVHSAGGVLMQSKKDLSFALGITSDDTYFQYTTTGWMMWTYMLSGLAIGARIILYDGSPFYPNLKTYVKLIHDQNVTVLGTSPRFLSEVQGQKINPLDIGSFENLKCIGCTGAVLTPPLFAWAQRAFGKDIHLVSTSGGTDICAAFVTGVPSLPVYAGEIQAKSLGMKVEIFSPDGKNIEDTGEPGELVCTAPHPSLPLKFWGDTEDCKKLRETYFSTFPRVWRQGDFMVMNPKTRGIMILGRSDGVLNPSGVRFGSGEIYSVLERFSSVIDDSLCIGQRRPQDNDERVLLFVKMRPGHKLTKALENDMREAIRSSLSARHVPRFFFEVDAIPYTVNGKKIEIAVKQIVSGSNIKPSGTVANPESLEQYYKFREIEKYVGVVKPKL